MNLIGEIGMIVKTDEALICDIVSLEKVLKIDGENRYGVKFYIKGGGSVSIKTGTEQRLTKMLEVLSEILLDEKIVQARTNDPNYAYIVSINKSVVKSKQLITSDKIELTTMM